ncbi:PhoPQ-activated pathogenicity-related protein [bacterium A37T11]|nr:PhoPQ-activated pathogenicity-related protein [bacterium A37T11]
MIKRKILTRQFLYITSFISLATTLYLPATAQTDQIRSNTALSHYLNLADDHFSWEVTDSLTTNDYTLYQLLLVSQKWRESVWKHNLMIIVPKEVRYQGALMFVTGGSVVNDEPNKSDLGADGTVTMLSEVAVQNKAVVAIVAQVPRQPMYGNLNEDALISYTLHQFKTDGDYTWPLLFPMVKSVVKAMDAVQQFTTQKPIPGIQNFVVTGFSKRGWTTWLTGSQDNRVVAIAPMVIDILNMPVNLKYQLDAWKEYSPQIKDYVELGIVQDFGNPEGKKIVDMIDPYSYRKQLHKPKMIFMGTNDPYWVVDAVKNYLDSIPGKNFLHYEPNVGHNLGDKKQAIQALSSFFGFTLQHVTYPECTWKIKCNKNGDYQLKVRTSKSRLVDVVLWSAQSEDMNFREDVWKGEHLNNKIKKRIKINGRLPLNGYLAFYLDLKYQDLNGHEYTQSTRMIVADNKQIL